MGLLPLALRGEVMDGSATNAFNDSSYGDISHLLRYRRQSLAFSALTFAMRLVQYDLIVTVP